VASTKFLGVLIDEGLTWSKHVDLVCTRSSKMLNILRIVLPLIHSSAHLTLYYSFLFPFMKYCNIVWGATFPTYLAKISKIQKKFLRMMSYSSKYAPSAPLFLRYKILPIENVNVYSCIFIHRFISKREDLPPTLQHFFTLISDTHISIKQGIVQWWEEYWQILLK